MENLAYKARAEGKQLVNIDQEFSISKTYVSCGHKVEKMPIDTSRRDCPCYGNRGVDRNLDAARNIL
ncbi:transposase [Halomonas sp. FME1]|uniref:Transposase n=1 Tax=Halomonas casei TaxID=2742613 RepID=A0ABR9F4I2_9GAMM|nr:transposase [Halomonas casei]